MHYLFEKIFREPAQQRAQWTPQQLEERLAALVEGYARENLGGLELLSGREKYRLSRLVQSACKLIRHVEEELAQSRFVPEKLEWGLGAGRDAPPLRIPTAKGTVTVGGTIDRVDVYLSLIHILERRFSYTWNSNSVSRKADPSPWLEKEKSPFPRISPVSRRCAHREEKGTVLFWGFTSSRRCREFMLST